MGVDTTPCSLYQKNHEEELRYIIIINGPGELDLRPWNWYASRIKGGEPSFRIWER